ncbi:ARMD1 protein, partial [Penelope pileata]|nr:ARMD1 protein [Penelope pileata]
MTSVKEQEAIRKLMVFLKEWDNAHKVARSHILDNFIKSNNSKTEPELELEFSQGASLFLARLTAWLRMTYLCTYSTCLSKLLKAIGIFLSAPSGRRYIIEFLEIGGISMLLEILGLSHLKEEDKRESVKLLQLVANTGRKYKELICESYGVQSLAEVLATCSSVEAQDDAQFLLESLGHGNPKYQDQVYRGLVAVLQCGNPYAQQLALQTLRGMQDTVGEAPPVLVEPLLSALGSARPEVRHEATQLLRALVSRRAPPPLLPGLVAALSPPARTAPARREETAARADLHRREPTPAYIQQAAAAKAIGILAKESAEVAEELIQLKVVHSLMVAVGNLDHTPSQKHASLSLEYFVRTYPFVEEHVRKAVGHRLFQLFMDCPETWYTNIDPAQAEELASNIEDSPKDFARIQSTEDFSGLLNT